MASEEINKFVQMAGEYGVNANHEQVANLRQYLDQIQINDGDAPVLARALSKLRYTHAVSLLSAKWKSFGESTRNVLLRGGWHQGDAKNEVRNVLALAAQLSEQDPRSVSVLLVQAYKATQASNPKQRQQNLQAGFATWFTLSSNGEANILPLNHLTVDHLPASPEQAVAMLDNLIAAARAPKNYPKNAGQLMSQVQQRLAAKLETLARDAVDQSMRDGINQLRDRLAGRKSAAQADAAASPNGGNGKLASDMRSASHGDNSSVRQPVAAKTVRNLDTITNQMAELSRNLRELWELPAPPIETKQELKQGNEKLKQQLQQANASLRESRGTSDHLRRQLEASEQECIQLRASLCQATEEARSALGRAKAAEDTCRDREQQLAETRAQVEKLEQQHREQIERHNKGLALAKEEAQKVFGRQLADDLRSEAENVREVLQHLSKDDESLQFLTRRIDQLFKVLVSRGINVG